MVVLWSDWDPRGVVVTWNGKKVVLECELLQTPRNRVRYDISETSMCVGIGGEFLGKMREFEEYVCSYVGPLARLWYGHEEYKSSISESEEPYMRVNYNSQTDMFDEQDGPINTVAKDTYVRMILRFKVTVTKTAYRIVPELVQLKIAPEPVVQMEEWLGD